MTTAQEMADKIADIAAAESDITHGRMISAFGDEARGDISLEIGENVIVMVGASEKLTKALRILRDETPRRVEVVPCHWLCHLSDGSPIPANMPRAIRPPKKGYKTPHFASVFWRPVRPSAP